MDEFTAALVANLLQPPLEGDFKFHLGPLHGICACTANDLARAEHRARGQFVKCPYEDPKYTICRGYRAGATHLNKARARHKIMRDWEPTCLEAPLSKRMRGRGLRWKQQLERHAFALFYVTMVCAYVAWWVM